MLAPITFTQNSCGQSWVKQQSFHYTSIVYDTHFAEFHNHFYLFLLKAILGKNAAFYLSSSG
jgi:hypothetical protein